MHYWLVKSEASVYSIDDLAKDKQTDWHGVRNYQARNYLKSMEVGDLVLFYHSVDKPLGIAGLAKVVAKAKPDKTQFVRSSDYYDPKASQQKPRWFCPELAFVTKYKEMLELEDLHKVKELKNMPLLQPGSRLSVQPVTECEFKAIMNKLTVSY